MTGRELVSIEDAFGLDALALLSALNPNTAERPGYTRGKALYALAWISKHRVDPSQTFDAFLDSVDLGQIDFEDEENPTNAASLAADSVTD